MEENRENKESKKMSSGKIIAICAIALFLIVGSLAFQESRKREANLYAFEETLLHFRIPYKDIYIFQGELVVEYSYDSNNEEMVMQDVTHILGTYAAFAQYRNEDLLVRVYSDGIYIGNFICKHRWAELYLRDEIDAIEFYNLATETLEWE